MISTDTLYDLARDVDKDYARDAITREQRNSSLRELEASWKLWLAVENGIAHLNQPAQDAIFRYAWDQGHASGYFEVGTYYAEVAAIALLASK
jgi:hypothetical protein